MKTFCVPHLERTGKEIPVYKIVAATPMCRDCFRGQPVFRDSHGVPRQTPAQLKRARMAQRRYVRRHRELVARRRTMFSHLYRDLDRETAVY